MSSSTDSLPFYTNVPSRFDHTVSYADFNRIVESHEPLDFSGATINDVQIVGQTSIKQTQTESLILAEIQSSSDVEQNDVQFPTLINDDESKPKKAFIRSFAEPISVKEHFQRVTTSTEMNQNRTNLQSIKENSTEKVSATDRNSNSTFDDEINRKTQRAVNVSPPKYSNKIPNSSRSTATTKTGKAAPLKLSNSFQTPRSLALVPTMTNRSVQGVLVRFFRVGDEFHRGVQLAINLAELKSWEAFLNYLNRQPNLVLGNGAIKNVYRLNGEEIRSIHQFQHRQSYVVSSGAFFPTNFRHMDDEFFDDFEYHSTQEMLPSWNNRSSVFPRWQLTSIVPTEPIYLVPYSRLNIHETLLMNRNLNGSFEQWLEDQVSEILSHHINRATIRYLFAVTKFAFIEVKSFSKLFHLLKMTDTFIACTENDYSKALDEFDRIRPSELFIERSWNRPVIHRNQQTLSIKPPMDDAKISLQWIYGYDGSNAVNGTLHTLPENEILYVIDSICILYEPNLQQQRFYLEHVTTISCLNVHRHQSLVASSEIGSKSNNNRAAIHIWNHTKLATINEIRKDQFGSSISLLKFSNKSDDNLLLVVARDKPQIVLFIDWKLNELIYTITCKSDTILSVSFAFDTTEWIACVSERRVLFYHIDWARRPLHLLERRESEVQNVYTGAAASDFALQRFLVGDKVGNVYVWSLINNEPKLIDVHENILQADVALIVPINRETFVLANEHDQIKVWNLKSNSIEQIRVNEEIGSIRSVCSLEKQSKTVAIVISTRMNYMISKQIDSDEFYLIMRGPTSPPVSLCSRTKNQQFYVITSDRHVFKWNNRKKSIDWSTKSTHPFACADVHPERNIIVIGTETSKLVIYDTLSSFYITTITLKVNTGVKSVRFSPDGSYLAAGLQNGLVFIFDVLGNGDFHLRHDGILRNEAVSVVHVSWSSNGLYLLAIYSDNDYNLWSVPSFEIIRGKKIQQITWQNMLHPITCEIFDPTIVNSHASAIYISKTLILCCSNDGHLRLFRTSQRTHFQTFQFGLGPLRNVVPASTKNHFLLSFVNQPIIAEIEVETNTVEI